MQTYLYGWTYYHNFTSFRIFASRIICFRLATEALNLVQTIWR